MTSEMLRTLLTCAERLAEICRLTVDPACILEHLEKEAKLAQEAGLVRTFGPYVPFCQLAYWA